MMVSEKKIRILKELKEKLEKYKCVGILDMYKLPARQLFEIRDKLRHKAEIVMVKKRILKRALKSVNMEKLYKYVGKQPAVLLTNENPFKLALILEESKSRAYARDGDIAPEDIVVKAGPTNLSPGPVIGEFQRLKIPVKVGGNVIEVVKDTVVVRKGEVINANIAGLLMKLDIKPIYIGLNLLAVMENNIIYEKDILFRAKEEYKKYIETAVRNSMNLALNINYVCKLTIEYILKRAYINVLNLALNINYVCKLTIEYILRRIYLNVECIKNKIGGEKVEEVYAALLLHTAGKEIKEDTIKKVLEAAGIKIEEAKIKALVANLEGVNIEEAIKQSHIPVPSTVPQTVEEKKEEEKKEEEKEKKEEEAVSGLSSLFG